MLASYDEAALCAPAFRVLKHVVHAWVKDIADQRSEYADDQVRKSLLSQLFAAGMTWTVAH
jgi:hypothetical protein